MRNEGADFFLKRVLDNARRAFVNRRSSNETWLREKTSSKRPKNNRRSAFIHVAAFEARHGGA